MRTFETRDDALAYVLEHVLFGPGAGACRDAALAEKYAAAGAKVVNYGSVTWDEQAINPGDNFWFDEETGNSVNAWGIGNKGTLAHLDDVIDAKARVNKHGATLWVSGSVGKTADSRDYYNIARTLHTNKAADVLKANFSCGNITRPDGTYKPNICQDLGALHESMAAFCEGAQDTDTAAKLMPTTDQATIEYMVEACVEYGFRYIVFANTIANCYFEKPDGKPAISMRRGGAGGRILVPIVTTMLQVAKPMLKGTGVKLIASGGIQKGRHAYYYLQHRADGFFYTSVMWRRNFDPKVTRDIVMGDHEQDIPVQGLVDFLWNHGLPD